MPNNHLFTVCGPNAEQLESDLESRLFIPVNDVKTSVRLTSLYESSNIQEGKTQLKEMAQQKQVLRRPRSQTLPDISINSAKRIGTAGNVKTKTPLRLTKSLEFVPTQKTTTSPTRKRSRSLLPNQAKVSFNTVSTSQRSNKDTQRINYKLLSKGRPSIDITAASTVPKTTQARSFSIPGDDLNSIYSIVKARSLALKWYRNGGGGINGKMTRARRKKSVALPTIMDEKTNISLCKAKCSPQFEQVVHLLRDEVDNIEDDIQVLSLE